MREWFSAGADEVLTAFFSPEEQRRGIERCGPGPSATSRSILPRGFPGTTEIERDVRRRLETGEEFAVCYADLDHFKEYNDRYSYYDGDRVIYLLSRILHDVVKGLLGARGFVGHIGGDDFIFIVPATGDQRGVHRDPGRVRHADPAAVQRPGPARGVFLRQGSARPAAPGAADDAVDRHRDEPEPEFTHPAQVSELATEMKSYAKTLPGSVFVVDRRARGEAGGT